MARQLMPKSGVVMPYVVVSRDTTIAGVASVDGQAGVVNLTGKYVTKATADQTYVAKTAGDAAYLSKTDAANLYLPKLNPVVPAGSVLSAMADATSKLGTIKVIKAGTDFKTTFGDVLSSSEIASKTNPTVLIGSAAYTFYHTGYKPTLAELGAAKSGQNTDITSLSNLNSVNFAGGSLVGTNAGQGSVYFRGKAPASGVGTEVYLNGTDNTVTFNAPGGVKTPNTFSSGNQTITGKGDVLKIVNTDPTVITGIAQYKADTTTAEWGLGTMADGSTRFISAGKGTLQFSPILATDVNKRRAFLESAGHRIEFGGSAAAGVVDPNNYYVAPSDGSHIFSGSTRTLSITAASTSERNGSMRLWGAGDRASVLEFGVDGGYLFYGQRLKDGTVQFHTGGTVEASTNVVAGTAVITPVIKGSNGNLVTFKPDGGTTVTANTGANIDVSTNKSIYLNCGSGGAVTTNGALHAYSLDTTGGGIASKTTIAATTGITTNAGDVRINNGSGSFYAGVAGGAIFAGRSPAAGTSDNQRGRLAADGNVGGVKWGSSATAVVYLDTFLTNHYAPKTSDKRAKKDITPINLKEAYDFVEKAQTYSFKYKATDKKGFGFIAQEVDEKWVDTAERLQIGKDEWLDGGLTLDAGQVSAAVLIPVVRDLVEQVRKLSAKVEELENANK